MYSFNGDYTLHSLKLNLPNNRVVDLSNIFLELNLFESLFDNTMSGSVILVDSNNLISNLPLLGNEEIEIGFNTAGLDQNAIKYKGVLYKVGERVQAGDRSWSYGLYFHSHESFTNINTTVSKGYRNTVSNIVKSVHDMVKTDKRLRVTETSGIYDFAIPYSHPFKIINHVSRRAVSNVGDLGYLYYEDSREFNYRPVQELLGQTPSVYYHLSHAGMIKDFQNRLGEKFLSIQAYKVLDTKSVPDKISEAANRMTVDAFDVVTKQRTAYEFDYQKDVYNPLKSLGRQGEGKELGIHPSSTRRAKLAVNNSVHHVLEQRNDACLAQLNNVVLDISVFGNSDTKVGDVISIDLPSYERLDKDYKQDALLSGKYLVGNIKHTINRKQYMQYMTVYKDAVEVIQ